MAYTYATTDYRALETGEMELVIDVSPDAATGDITVTGYTSVRVVGVVPLIEDCASNMQVAVQALRDGTTLNKINLKLWKAVATAASAYGDFRLLVRGIR